ncbi:MAG: hypothetical protein WCG87_04060 [Bacteroidota bacterium]
MQASNRIILFLGMAMGCCSIMYFLLLIIHLSFVLIVPIIALSLVAVFKWLWADNNAINKLPWWQLTILAICMSLMVYNSYPLASKYGGWDAWALWNHRAHYLADGQI